MRGVGGRRGGKTKVVRLKYKVPGKGSEAWERLAAWKGSGVF